MGIKELLIPQEKRFYDLLETQAGHMVRGAEALVEGLARWDNPQEIRRGLKDIEHEGDQVVHDIYQALNQTFITPIDREDIAALTGSLDDVLDFTYATVNHMVLYDIRVVPEPLKEAAKLLKEQTVHLRAAVGGLRNVKAREAITPHLVEVNRLENATDDLTNKAIADLFRPAEGKDAFFVMKMKDIYNYIETATDKAEDVADVIGDIVVKHS
jgi:predicted phosphate transport protein (TIGR00153 family)